MVDGVEGSREIKKAKALYLHDRECRAEQFRWNGVYSGKTGEDS